METIDSRLVAVRLVCKQTMADQLRSDTLTVNVQCPGIFDVFIRKLSVVRSALQMDLVVLHRWH